MVFSEQQYNILEMEMKQGMGKSGKPYTIYKYKCLTNDGRLVYASSFRSMYPVGTKGTFLIDEQPNPRNPQYSNKSIYSKVSDVFAYVQSAPYVPQQQTQTQPVTPALNIPVTATTAPELKLNMTMEDALIPIGRGIIAQMMKPEYAEYVLKMVENKPEFTVFMVKQDGFMGKTISSDTLDKLYNEFIVTWKQIHP